MTEPLLLTKKEMDKKVDNVGLVLKYSLDMLTIDIKILEATRGNNPNIRNNCIYDEVKNRFREIINYIDKMTLKDLDCCASYRIWECKNDQGETIFMLQEKILPAMHFLII